MTPIQRKANLCFFVMLHELFGRQAMQVAKLGLHHDRQLTQGLLDDPFRNAIDRPADVSLKRQCHSVGRQTWRLATLIASKRANNQILPPAFLCTNTSFLGTLPGTPSSLNRCSLWWPLGCEWRPPQRKWSPCPLWPWTPKVGWPENTHWIK